MSHEGTVAQCYITNHVVLVCDGVIVVHIPYPIPRLKILDDLLKALLLDLRLSSGNSRSGVRVDKAAALLAVLELSTLSRADANGGRVDLGATL